MEQVLPVRYCYNDGEPFTEIGSDLTRLAFGRYIKYWHLVEVAVAVREKCAARAFACDHKEPVFWSESASNDYFPLSSAPSLSRVSFMSPRLSPFLKLSTAFGLSPMAEYRSPRQS